MRVIRETRGDPRRERQWYKVQKGVQAGVHRGPLGHVKEFGFPPRTAAVTGESHRSVMMEARHS